MSETENIIEEFESTPAGIVVEPSYPEGAIIVGIPPEDDSQARNEAFELANRSCTVLKPGCTTYALFAHQKQLRILGAPDYARSNPEAFQTSDNLVVCCPNCHLWIHNNPEEATSLGYLDR